jgi:hypothetical protein
MPVSSHLSGQTTVQPSQTRGFSIRPRSDFKRVGLTRQTARRPVTPTTNNLRPARRVLCDARSPLLTRLRCGWRYSVCVRLKLLCVSAVTRSHVFGGVCHRALAECSTRCGRPNRRSARAGWRCRHAVSAGRMLGKGGTRTLPTSPPRACLSISQRYRTLAVPPDREVRVSADPEAWHDCSA